MSENRTVTAHEIFNNITFYDKSNEKYDRDVFSIVVYMNEIELAKYRWIEKSMKYKRKEFRNTLEISTKMMELANGFILDDNGEKVILHRRKLEAVKELIHSNPHKKIVVSYWFKHDFDGMRDSLGIGEMLNEYDNLLQWNNSEEKLAYINPYCDDETPILADMIIWYSPIWSFHYFNLINHRVSLANPNVQIIRVVCADTIDEEIIASLDAKKNYCDEYSDVLEKNYESES